ncbi:MAG: glycosyltransferase family 4 protein [Minisyncoccia bacterium]|jgi:glycosyltransferase involved in cell wall biosynthesis
MENLTQKKILFVITKSNWGGAQRYVYDLATHFKKAGANVAVAFGGTGEANAPFGVLAVNLQEAGINRIPVQSFMRDISFLREFKALRELTQIFKKERPNIIHLNSSKAGGVGALAGHIAGVPKIIFTSHGLAYDEDRNLLARTAIFMTTWFTFLLCDSVILISKDTFKRARRMPFCKNKTHLIYNGIAPVNFEAREKARRKLLSDASIQNGPWIGTIAELTRNKGLSYLIDAAALLKKRGLNSIICIVGHGEEYANLKKLVAEKELSDQIYFPGFVFNAANLLCALDIFTLTSVKEGLPYVLLEAGQAGCAIVGSRIPGIMDVIDNTTGILVDAKDPEAIAAALETLLRDSKRRQELAKNLRARISENFSIEQMLEKTAAVYR